jgi:CBS domain-containing protein
MAKFTVDVLENLRVEDHYTKGQGNVPVALNMRLADFLEHVSTTAESFFVVSKPTGEPCGVISLDHVRSIVGEDDEHLDVMLVSDAMTPLHSVAPGAHLRDALDALVASGHDELPVIDPARASEVLGMISQRRISAEYNAEILRRRLGGRARSEDK